MLVEIKLKKIKTCNHCPAYQPVFPPLGGWVNNTNALKGACYLGYEVELTDVHYWKNFTTWEDAYINTMPKNGLCPKPKNIKEKVEISKLIDVHRIGKIQ